MKPERAPGSNQNREISVIYRLFPKFTATAATVSGGSNKAQIL